jgi:SAM-dependent methyltransferase
MSSVREKWDARYRLCAIDNVHPARVLSENRHLLPCAGEALEIACGLGGNARLLAQHGLVTRAWDVSPVAIAKLQDYAHQHSLSLVAEVRDVESCPPSPAVADVIVVTRFLARGLIPAMIQALRPGGLIFYQTFTSEGCSETVPRNPAYRLAVNELLELFCSLRVLVYREEGRIGDCTTGFRDEAMLVGVKNGRSGDERIR